MGNGDCGIEARSGDAAQRRVLWWLLAINGVMFVGEFAAGWLAASTALIADSIDMLADAGIYAISLLAVGRPTPVKARAARYSGLAQMLLGLGVLGDILRRVVFGSDPDPAWMLGVSLIALAANTVCTMLLVRHRAGEIHMRASWIFTRNDVIANLAVILAAGLVYRLESRIPDLVIGFGIASLLLHGAWHILRDARRQMSET